MRDVRTQLVVQDFERHPGGLENISKEFGSREAAITALVGLTAPNYIKPGEDIRPGQIAHELASWARAITAECSEIYRDLVHNPEGPHLDKKSANAHPELVTLHSIRRGVRIAMRSHFTSAQRASRNR